MDTELKALFKSIDAMHLAAYSEMSDAKQRAVKVSKLSELADNSYVLREIVNRLDDMKKEVNAVRSLINKKACLLWLKSQEASPIITNYCTATPKTVLTPKLPAEGTEEYKTLLAHFGFTEADMGMFKPSWTKMLIHFEKLAEEGKPFPPGTSLGESFPVFKMDIRKKKDILDD